MSDHNFLIDTHTHLDGEEFATDLNEVISRAKDANVQKMLIPAINLKDLPHLMDVCSEHPETLYPMVGLHPEDVKADYNEVLQEMENTYLPSDRFVAIGEIGLDFYWDTTYKQEQIKAFEVQINWALKYDLPLMIHTRSAHKELVEIMNQYREQNLHGVFHCFTGTEDEASELLSFEGFMLGIGGVSTFKKSTLPSVLATTVPLSRIVLETDSPYMAPVPHRGKRNESAYVVEVAKKLADVYNIPIEDVIAQTTFNALDVFNKKAKICND